MNFGSMKGAPVTEVITPLEQTVTISETLPRVPYITQLSSNFPSTTESTMK